METLEESCDKMIDRGFRYNPIFKDVLREMTKGFQSYCWHFVEELLIEKGCINEDQLKKDGKNLKYGGRASLARALKHLGLHQTVKAIHVGLTQAEPDNVDDFINCTKRLEQMLPTRADKEYAAFDNSKLTDTPDTYSFESTDNSIASVHEGCIQAGQDGTCIIMMQSKDNAADRKYYKVMVEGGRLYDASKNPPSDGSDDGGQKLSPVPGWLYGLLSGVLLVLAVVFWPKCGGYENGHEWVDLGLSVKWATCNVGADSPGEYGDYFAWGETSPKDEYTWRTLKYCNGTSDDSFSKYNQNKGGTRDNLVRLELSDDAARQQWGGSWRMPTSAEFQELVNKCQWSWTTEGGHEGYKVTGPNGRSIFLPAAGCRYGSSLNDAVIYGNYWSSSLRTSYSNFANYLHFGSGDHSVYYGSRSGGQSVRSVTE